MNQKVNLKNRLLYISAIIGLMALLAPLLFRTLQQSGSETEKQYWYTQLKGQLEDQLQEMELAHQEWKSLLQKTSDSLFQISFDNAKFQHYFFKNAELSYWSDFRFVPSFEQLKGNYSFQLLENQSNFYLCRSSTWQQDSNSLQAITLIPLYQNYKLDNQYLKSQFNPKLLSFQKLSIQVELAPQESQNIYSPKGEFLFSVHWQKEPLFPLSTEYYVLSFIFLFGFLTSAFFIHRLTQSLHQRTHHSKAILVMFAYLLFIRGLLIKSGLVFHFSGLSILGQNIRLLENGSLGLSLSLGDHLLNLLFLGFALAYLLKHLSQIKLLLWALKKKSFRLTGAILSFSLALISVQLLDWSLGKILLNSDLPLDINRDLDWSLISLLSILFFIIVSGVFFLQLHILSRVYLQFVARSNIKELIISLLPPMLIFIALHYFSAGDGLFLGLCSCLYFFIISYLGLARRIYQFRYISFLYLFSSAIFLALVSTFSIYHYGSEKSLAQKSRFALLQEPERDELAEVMIEEVMNNIQSDSLVLALWKDSSDISFPNIRQYLLEKYLGNSFKRYETKFIFYNDQKQLLFPKAQKEEDYAYFERYYQRIDYRTNYDDIYFISKTGINFIRHYISFFEYQVPGDTLGYLILDLKQRRNFTGNVYPELLVERHSENPQESKNYRYAIFDQYQLVYGSGNFNYARDFNIEWLNAHELYLNGITQNAYQHFGVELGSKKVIVSEPIYSFAQFFSNFAFLFLILVLEIFLLIIVYGSTNHLRGHKVNFATRIQFFLNISFVLPLLVVSITTLGIISQNYREDLYQSFLEETRKISRNIFPLLEKYQSDESSAEVLSLELEQTARNIGLDINIFDAQGKLLISSQPAIYTTGVISPYINPDALKAIALDQQSALIERESVGALSYQAVYRPLRSLESGNLMGIMSVPFFDYNVELRKRLISVLSTIINIFVSILLAFLALSYFASQILISPLKLITQKIRKTSFYDHNEPLKWESNDEFGLFVREYNRMLEKLDDSKEALARIQREEAWREIAQQVAHEIKNPLTPIRLTLQMMQKRLESQGEKFQAMFERPINTLLEQVDTLNDIANSFSSFAKMPMPASERFEIGEVLKSTESLYHNEKIDIHLDLSPGKFYIQGDQKLMGRVFTNLVKNAIEANEDNQRVHMKIQLSSPMEGLIRISFQDDGAGIDENIRDKVFMPNFTTKTSGSGIGLALSKRGIEHAGGRIWFETESGEGTTFFIELPLID